MAENIQFLNENDLYLNYRFVLNNICVYLDEINYNLWLSSRTELGIPHTPHIQTAT